MKPIKIVTVVGPPLCGKTTHSRLLAENYNGVHISSGAIAKALMDDKTRQAYSQGQLSPHGERISRAIRDTIMVNSDRPLFLDGFPRTVEQLEMLDYWWFKHFKRYGGKMLALHINPPPTAIIARVAVRQRDEFDTERVTLLRNDTYIRETLPIFEAMKSDHWTIARYTLAQDLPPERIHPLLEETTRAFLSPEGYLHGS